MGWAKGQSGNPHGRRVTKPLEDALRLELAADPKRIRRIARALLDAAEKGDTKATAMIADRLDGPVIRQLEATLTPSSPLLDATSDEKRALFRELLDLARAKATDLVPVQPKGIAKQ